MTPAQVAEHVETIAGPPVLTGHPVTRTLFERLASIAPEEAAASTDPQRQREFVKAIVNREPDRAFAATRMLAVRPPDTVHRMQKSDPQWVGDFFSANMIAHALNVCLLRGGAILDLGASSGSLVRMLAAYDGRWKVMGCDPVQSSVEWAKANIPTGEFFHMGYKPPLDLPDASLDGVTAISVWSHHRADAAKAWADEVARVLKPGGWFAVTFSSLHHVRWLAKRPKATSEMLRRILDDIAATGNYFIPAAIDGASDGDWGQSTFSREAFFAMFLDRFRVAGYFPGMNQGNQDLAVFVRA